MHCDSPDEREPSLPPETYDRGTGEGLSADAERIVRAIEDDNADIFHRHCTMKTVRELLARAHQQARREERERLKTEIRKIAKDAWRCFQDKEYNARINNKPAWAKQWQHYRCGVQWVEDRIVRLFDEESGATKEAGRVMHEAVFESLWEAQSERMLEAEREKLAALLKAIRHKAGME